MTRLLWINGPFGGGKTQTAYEILHRLPGSVVCDPESVGFGLHRMMPRDIERGDFQDFAAWRLGVFEVLDKMLTEYQGTVIAPMTIAKPEYFAETVGRLRMRGHDVRHFALLADREEILRRLSHRLFGRAVTLLGGEEAALRREAFAVDRVDALLESLRHEEFAEHIWTDELSIQQVAERIATSAGLTLTPNTDSPLRGRMRRTWTGIKHIRIFP